jgi:hypothetical protein
MDKETELYKAICDRQETLIKDLLKVIEDYQTKEEKSKQYGNSACVAAVGDLLDSLETKQEINQRRTLEMVNENEKTN